MREVVDLMAALEASLGIATGADRGTPEPTCPHGDPCCPCPDGLQCHYEGEDAMPEPTT